MFYEQPSLFEPWKLTKTPFLSRGSGTTNYPYFSAPADAIRARAQQDGATVTLSASDSTADVANTVRDADAAIVFLTSNSGEGYLLVDGSYGDRLNLDPLHNGNQLVQAVAQANKNTIVVVHSVGPLVLESILSTPGVTAVVWAGLPGQESGNALVDVLYGSVSPSGKLPYTIARATADYGTAIVPGDDNFPEGLFVDYRHFDRANIQPRFEFGYGLCKSHCVVPKSCQPRRKAPEKKTNQQPLAQKKQHTQTSPTATSKSPAPCAPAQPPAPSCRAGAPTSGRRSRP